jgi:Domain of unknown function (DUF4184)
MPLTFFAHQAFVLPLKLRWPKRFDATTLCIGSMAPDLAYPINPWLAEHSHKPVGLLWALPFTMVVTWIVRDYVASTAFAHIPDFGPFRIHSLRSLQHRQPNRVTTLISALIGTASHIGIDSFTHDERLGSHWLGFHHQIGMFHGHSVTTATMLQFLGHTVGSIIGLLLLLRIGQQRLIDRWYGKRVVAADRAFTLTLAQRVVFAIIVGIGVVIGIRWGWHSTQNWLFAMFDATAIATFIACLMPFCKPASQPTSQPKTNDRHSERNGFG